ncbi:MAG: helix-turn-helix domain-containing protein [Coriobacteriia bacterium]|nr:helix-turn-helix domain-containing protein [Coriobacteriia bacterium]
MTTLGDMLIEARKNAGLSAHEMAQRTRIMLAAIYNLEDDNHSALPAAGYVRGYILSYCKICDVDPTPYLKQYEIQSGNNRRDAITEPSYSGGFDSQKPEHEMNWKIAAIVALVIVLIAGGLILINRSGNNSEPEVNPMPVVLSPDEAGDEFDQENESEEEQALTPFSFTIAALEGRASEVRIVIDGDEAFNASLTSGNEESFDRVRRAELEIANPENVILSRGEDNIPIPDSGVLTLVAPEE